MAFSMFVRNSVCANRAFSQQFMRLATQAALPQRLASGSLPLTSHVLNQTTNTPLLDAARSFRTTPTALATAEKAHDHAKLWVVERITSAALIPLIPLALLMPNKVFDSVLAILITAHSFWGLEAVAVDYARASVLGPLLPKLVFALNYLIAIATLGGLFYIISHDIGIANSFKQLWAIKANQQA